MKLIDKNQFDTIYHEHFSYFSLITLKKLFSLHELEIFDVEELSTHGGSLRIFVKHRENDYYKEKKSVKKLLEKERVFGLKRITTYTNFSREVYSVKEELLSFLEKAKKANKVVVGYGAPAKGNTLLNFCKIDSPLCDAGAGPLFGGTQRHLHRRSLDPNSCTVNWPSASNASFTAATVSGVPLK